MKNVGLFFLCILAFAKGLIAQTEPTTDGTPAQIAVGTQLVYEVTTATAKYQFIVTVKKLDDGITFDWRMTAPINKKGTVIMTEDAVESAAGLFNYFANDTARLDDQTSVWVSRTMWREMHNEDEMVLISLDNDEATGFFREDGEAHKISYKGKSLDMKVSNLKSLTDNQTITVWENEKFPIILKMDLGWTIELKEIK